MPADGRRKKIVVGVRDALKTATGVNYFNDLSVTGTVELGRETFQSLQEGANRVAIRVWDGGDRHRWTGSADIQGELEVLVHVLVRDAAPTLVERFNDVMADITLAIGANRGLGGSSTTLRIGGIDPPTYDFDVAVAHTIVRITATYDYTAGADR